MPLPHYSNRSSHNEDTTPIYRTAPVYASTAEVTLEFSEHDLVARNATAAEVLQLENELVRIDGDTFYFNMNISADKEIQRPIQRAIVDKLLGVSFYLRADFKAGTSSGGYGEGSRCTFLTVEDKFGFNREANESSLKQLKVRVMYS